MPAWCAQVGPGRAGFGSHQAGFGFRWVESGRCTGSASPQLRSLPIEHQEWRLTGGRDGCGGRVEVFFRGTWSTVCDSTWYELEASVLCRTLGCGQPLLQLSFSHTLPTRMLYQCDGQQPSLARCQWTYNKSAPCHQSRAAGVICNGMGPPPLRPAGLGGLTACLKPWGSPVTHFLLPSSIPVPLLPGSQGLQMPTPMATVTPSNVTLLSRSGRSPAFPPPNPPPSRGAVGQEIPTGDSCPIPISPPPDSPVTAKDPDSDSDYEHYDFSSEPPVALSTFYSEHPTQAGDPPATLPGGAPGCPPIDVHPPLLSPQTHCAGTPGSSCSHPVSPPAPPATPRMPTPVLSHPRVPVSPAEPHPADSSSTSSGEWYENVQGLEPPGDPSPHPGEDSALAGQEQGDMGGCRYPLPAPASTSRSLPGCLTGSVPCRLAGSILPLRGTHAGPRLL
uniref:SRCR domain-containing protein n=1 Tax=Strix occidentalis caurina TaxID=311401 RepID=A0A8D0EKD8_STROC